MWKRTFDVLAALAGLLFLSPALLLIGLAVRGTSLGPALFRQQRLGQNSTTFEILKFRTLQNGTGVPGETLLQGDTRVTPVGRLLRETHLDELPQLWNVLMGHMSLVGPRPTSIEQGKNHLAKDPKYLERLRIRPGITGIAQLQGRMKAVRYGPRYTRLCDQIYIRNQSLRLDIWILLSTVVHMLRRRGI